MLCRSLMVWTLTFGSSCFALYNVNSRGGKRSEEHLEICSALAASVAVDSAYFIVSYHI